MEKHDGKKISGIKKIVRLKEFLQKWRNFTLGSIRKSNKKTQDGTISPAICKRLRGSNRFCDSDEDCMSFEPSHDIPRGHLPVYVAPELQRFIIPTNYLVDPLFKMLLEKVEEEFGFDHSGALTILCEIETFKYLLKIMENRHKIVHDNHILLNVI